MPRYFFHMRSDQGFIRDPDGSELPDLDAARAEAIVSARHLLADMLKHGREVDGQAFEIADEADEVLARIPFRSVLKLP